MSAVMFNQQKSERDMSAEIRISIRVEGADALSANNGNINVVLLRDDVSSDYVPRYTAVK